MARHVKRVTGETKLCLAGGVVLNCVANGKLLSSGLFDDLWIQPAAGDAGNALGTALLVHYHYLKNKGQANEVHDQQNVLPGTGVFRSANRRIFTLTRGSFRKTNKRSTVRKNCRLTGNW